jgi:enoyl-CoA hydratase/carnithine racemase
MTDDVLIERANGVAIITLNRPNALNALSTNLTRELDAILNDLALDGTLRAAIITGQGRAFSAGGDLLEFSEQAQSNPRQLIETLAFNQGVLAKLKALKT